MVFAKEDLEGPAERVFDAAVAVDGVAILGGFPVEVLALDLSGNGGDAAHPEVIKDGANDVQGVLKPSSILNRWP